MNIKSNYIKPKFKKESNPKGGLLALSTDLTIENDFQSVVVRTYPKIRNLKNTLLQYGATYASLSGSGSTVFGIFDDFETVSYAEKQMTQMKTHLVKPINYKKIFEY